MGGGGASVAGVADDDDNDDEVVSLVEASADCVDLSVVTSVRLVGFFVVVDSTRGWFCGVGVACVAVESADGGVSEPSILAGSFAPVAV